MQPVESQETPSWERNISEYDNIQHKKIVTDKFFWS